MLEQNPWYLEIIRCPDCLSDIFLSSGSVSCQVCGFIGSRQNLKPKSPKNLQLSFPRLPIFDIQASWDKIPSRPEITYSGPNAQRDSRELMSVIASHLHSKGRILDLGCGPRDQAIPVEYLGHQYVGIDYTNTSADFLGDAHAIPFASSSFDCVLSYAVLEHLHNPYVVIHEIARVLKPGGIYIGTVSQGEPFHESYFHLTPWGFISLISSVECLRVDRLWDSMDTIQALSRIGRYPRVIKFLLSQLDKIHQGMPLLAPRKMNWTKQEKELDKLYRAGSVCFCVVKE
jgi:SAM-dependent methyltransferase